ncbi:ubiquitin domain-containing protein UBFD1 isoform X1 [Cavia porcellus]|uniref:ubiquitin domain-containing protein UBFD1 isoform X1 n=1 Tax=Cavia porcellus TaxID=10141 RepID=UPI000350AB4C|nr:ubiquitin domain-containing protein UBFD1 isoform X1 [Cavia porcellus]
MAAAGAPDGMEESGMDTEAETVVTEAPARQLNCVEAEAAAGAAPEDYCDARDNLQPAPAQPPGDSAAQASVSNGEDAGGGAGRELELVDLKIIWNKTKHDVKVPLDSTGSELKQKIHSITGLPPAMQKVMYKGLVPEDKTLREIKVTSGAKIMVVGSTINDVLAVNTPKDASQQDAKAEENKKEPLCRQKQHRKVLDKGKPEDVMPSVKGVQERLPAVPLSGMYNKSGGKVRLTFKLEQDQLWIGTKERTEKLPMGSIKNVVSEPIEGHEDYHMMTRKIIKRKNGSWIFIFYFVIGNRKRDPSPKPWHYEDIRQSLLQVPYLSHAVPVTWLGTCGEDKVSGASVLHGALLCRE